MVVCLVRGADLHMAQLFPLPLTVSCSCKIQIGFTVLVPAHLGSPGQRAIKRMCVCVCVMMSHVITVTSLCWALALDSQHDAIRICCSVPGICRRSQVTAGTQHPQLSIDISCPCLHSAVNLLHAAAAVDQRDRQGNGQTDSWTLHKPALH